MTLAGTHYFLQPGLGEQKETLTMAFRFTQSGFLCQNQPWLAYVNFRSQGLALKIDPGCKTFLSPARVLRKKSALAVKLLFCQPGFFLEYQPWLPTFLLASQAVHILRGKTAPPPPFPAAHRFPTAPPTAFPAAHLLPTTPLCVPMM